MHLRHCEGSVTLRICGGTLPGDTIAGLWFIGVFHKAIDSWLQDTQSDRIYAHLPWLPEIVENASTLVPVETNSFADDLQRTHITRTLPELRDGSRRLTQRLEHHTKPYLLRQNHDKHTALVSFMGRGSNDLNRIAYLQPDAIPCKSQRSCRYLGP
jgi:hypothetical protein